MGVCLLWLYLLTLKSSGKLLMGNAFRRQICQMLVCEPQYRDL